MRRAGPRRSAQHVLPPRATAITSIAMFSAREATGQPAVRVSVRGAEVGADAPASALSWVLALPRACEGCVSGVFAASSRPLAGARGGVTGPQPAAASAIGVLARALSLAS
eukprot:4040884-Pleurochrysis_carterae.AAC.1